MKCWFAFTCLAFWNILFLALADNLPWDESIFSLAAECAGKAYQSTSDNQEVGSARVIQTLGKGDDSQRVNIYRSDDHGAVIIAWEGTTLQNLPQIINSAVPDIEFEFVSPDGRLGLKAGSLVSVGWQSQFFKNWDDAKNKLASVLSQYPNDKLYVTGHSEGGALCQFGALAIEHELGHHVDKVIALASPRLGNAVYASSFTDTFKDRFCGVTNGNDWVFDTVPLTWGYVHPSPLVWITPASGERFTYLDNAEALYTKGYIPNYLSMNDHNGKYFGVQIN